MSSAQVNPKIAFITNPHNPSGQMLPQASVRRVLDAASEDTLVVLDEAYVHYSEETFGMDLLREYKNLVVLRTMSKAFGLAVMRLARFLLRVQQNSFRLAKRLC